MILPLAAANRDPKQFVDPNVVKLERKPNLHLSFGSDAHRSPGAGLATLELRVALKEWSSRISDFAFIDPENIRWSGGKFAVQSGL
jgi:cytochrome P450